MTNIHGMHLGQVLFDKISIISEEKCFPCNDKPLKYIVMGAISHQYNNLHSNQQHILSKFTSLVFFCEITNAIRCQDIVGTCASTVFYDVIGYKHCPYTTFFLWLPEFFRP